MHKKKLTLSDYQHSIVYEATRCDKVIFIGWNDDTQENDVFKYVDCAYKCWADLAAKGTYGARGEEAIIESLGHTGLEFDYAIFDCKDFAYAYGPYINRTQLWNLIARAYLYSKDGKIDLNSLSAWIYGCRTITFEEAQRLADADNVIDDRLYYITAGNEHGQVLVFASKISAILWCRSATRWTEKEILDNIHETRKNPNGFYSVFTKA